MITELLDLMRVRSTAFVGKNIAAPWSISIEEHENLARFHLVVDGQTWMGLPGSKGVVLSKGDFAIIPRGLAHEYRNVGNTQPAESRFLPNLEAEAYFQPLADMGDGGTHLLCGYFRISEQTPPTILAHLPDLMVERSTDEASGHKFDLIVALIREELLKESPASPIVLNRLTEVLCLHAIQNWLTRSLTHDEHVHLRALANPKTKLVLESIHSDPGQDWTVDSLARLFGQSRTAFAAHFKTATGLTPISYVRRWRIRLASKMLEETNLTIDEVAFKVGYSDTNAFNRAFKRETGESPGAFKRMVRV